MLTKYVAAHRADRSHSGGLSRARARRIRSAQTRSARPPTAPQSVSASRRTAITEAVARVAPAVVTVQTEVVERVPVDPFEWMTGRQSGERVGAGLGSGFITRRERRRSSRTRTS